MNWYAYGLNNPLMFIDQTGYNAIIAPEWFSVAFDEEEYTSTQISDLWVRYCDFNYKSYDNTDISLNEMAYIHNLIFTGQFEQSLELPNPSDFNQNKSSGPIFSQAEIRPQDINISEDTINEFSSYMEEISSLIESGENIDSALAALGNFISTAAGTDFKNAKLQYNIALWGNLAKNAPGKAEAILTSIYDKAGGFLEKYNYAQNNVLSASKLGTGLFAVSVGLAAIDTGTKWAQYGWKVGLATGASHAANIGINVGASYGAVSAGTAAVAAGVSSTGVGAIVVGVSLLGVAAGNTASWAIDTYITQPMMKEKAKRDYISKVIELKRRGFLYE